MNWDARRAFVTNTLRKMWKEKRLHLASNGTFGEPQDSYLWHLVGGTLYLPNSIVEAYERTFEEKKFELASILR